MGIQEEIKQSKFRSKAQKAVINLLYTNNWLEERIRGFLSGHELTPQQYNVMRILRGSHPEPLSTLQIRERMLDKMSDTSRIVDRLVKKGLAAKRPCIMDKRLVDVNITPTGMRKLAIIDRDEQAMDDTMQNLSEDDLEHLNTLLDKLRANSEK